MRAEDKITNYYRWPRYWSGLEYGGGHVAEGSKNPVGELLRPESEPPPGTEDEIESRLRSANEVLGYKIFGRDAVFGEIYDFVVNPVTWQIILIVCDTTRWMPGRMVVLPPDRATAVHWEKQRVQFDLSKEEIMECPEYKENDTVDESFHDKVRVFFSHVLSRS